MRLALMVHEDLVEAIAKGEVAPERIEKGKSGQSRDAA
jgi:hypothetical protein